MLSGVRYYNRLLGVRGVISAVKSKVKNRPVLMEVFRSDVRHPFHLRVPSSDISTYEQIFLLKEYECNALKPPRTIVDAGANIGLASIYFANRFPDSKIIAIEPERSNFELLATNIAPYKNITGVHAALWHENKKINLVDPNLGKWGFMTQSGDGLEKFGSTLHEVQGMTIDTLMNQEGLDHIDVLKIDIEGAEREVFENTSTWIAKVDSLIVELHDRMKPGCSRNFFNNTNGFDDEWRQGENFFLTRRNACLTRRAHEVVGSTQTGS